MEQLAADLEAVLSAVVPAGPVVLVGHSMGGMTILDLAPRAPQLFGDRVLHGGSLSIPHPRMAERAFVLLPLAELDGNLTVPGLGSLRSLLERLAPQPIHLIAER